MELTVIQKLIPTSRYNWKSLKEMQPSGLCVHNTANEAPAENEVSYMINTDSKTSFHYAVDDVKAVQALPENRTGWHAGDNLGNGNMKHIGIEICYSLAKKLPEKEVYAKFDKAEKNATILIVDMLRRYNWGMDHVKKHQDFSGKYCPHRTLDLGWSRFLNMIENQMLDNKIFKMGDTIKFSSRGKLYHKSGEHWGYAEKGSVARIINYLGVEGAYHKFELGFHNVANVVVKYGSNFDIFDGEITNTDATPVSTPEEPVIDPEIEKLKNDIKILEQEKKSLEGELRIAKEDLENDTKLIDSLNEKLKTSEDIRLKAVKELNEYKDSAIGKIVVALSNIFKKSK
jgi:hypothetical protein